MTKRFVLAFTLTALLSFCSVVSASAEAPPIDINDPAQAANGQTAFNHTCAGYCHGRDGRQGRGPSLRGREDLSAEQIHHTIENGRKSAGKYMPAWKGQIDDQTIWQIIAFILSLRSEH